MFITQITASSIEVDVSTTTGKRMYQDVSDKHIVSIYVIRELELHGIIHELSGMTPSGAGVQCPL